MVKFSRQVVDVRTLPKHVVIKWSAKILEEGFVPFPKKLLRCLPRLFSGPDAAKELAVILAIVDFNRPMLTRQPSLAFLSFVAGLPEADVRVILDRFVQKAYLQIFGTEEELKIDLGGLIREIEKETDP